MIKFYFHNKFFLLLLFFTSFNGFLFSQEDINSIYKDTIISPPLNSIKKYKSGLITVSVKNESLSKFYKDLDHYFPNNIEVKGEILGIFNENIETFDIDYLVDEIAIKNDIIAIKELNKYYIYASGSEQIIQNRPLIYHYKPRNLNVQLLFNNVSNLNLNTVIIENTNTNEILIQGKLSEIKNTVKILRTLDRPLDKVNIEILVVEYRHGNSFNWKYDITSGTSGRIDNGSAFDVAGAISGTYNFLSKLSPSFKFNLQALVEDQNANIVTNPHVVAINNEMAEINIAETQYLRLQSAGLNGLSTNLQQIQASLDLKVTAQILIDQNFILDVDVDNTEFTPNSRQDQIQTISSNIDTKVLARNGETLIIGGLVQFREFDNSGGVPFLSKIPLVGLLFKQKNRSKEFIETVIYITPYMAPLTSRAYEKITIKDDEIERKLDLNGKN
jgi:general secretion pathway protein D